MKDKLLDTETAAVAAGVKPATIRQWKRRGLITPRAGDPRRPLWSALDIMSVAQRPRGVSASPFLDNVSR